MISKHSKIGIVLLLLMSLLPRPAVAQKVREADRQSGLYRQAQDLYQKQKYAAAQQIYDQIASGQADAADLSTADAAYYAAVCSEKLDNDDAYYRLEEFLRLYPQSSHANMARFYLGNFYYSRGDFERALGYYRQVNGREVEFDHRSEFNFKMGYCYFQKGDFQKAQGLLSQQVGGQSKYRNSSLYYYAHIQYANGQYDLALRNFRELQHDSKFAKIAPAYIARIYYYLGREDELLEMAPALLQDRNTFKKNEIHQMVGEIYFNRGEYQRALEHYQAVDEEVSRANTESCTPQDNDYQVGYSYYMMGQYDQAAQYLVRKTGCTDSVGQNAMYVLGDCYLRLGRKKEARSMFLQSSKMDHSARIKEDALFNYAKLSCELNETAYSENIKSFENYLQQYPRSSHRTEVQEILTELYCSTNNYREAIRLLEQVPERNSTLNQAYQRALLNRGIELCNSGKRDEGVAYYEKAVQVNALPKMTADANFLLGEKQYEAGDLAAAERSLNKFLLSSYANTSAYADDARYNYAYLLFNKRRFDEALDAFSELSTRLEGQSGRKQRQMRADVHNRLGDCLYVESRFPEAIAQYDRVIEAQAKDADYATLQKALAYGAQGKNSEKLTYLNYVFEKYENSTYQSKAMLEIANTYMMCDNSEMAMTYYSNFVKSYPQSAYVKTALLNQGLIYYNTERPTQALNTFDRLLTHYPGTDEARDALSVVKNIYVAQNRVDEYFAYVQRTTKTNISAAEQDSTTFLAAEGFYQESDFTTASGLSRYLDKFPNGLFAVKAHYLLADSYRRLDSLNAAFPHYEAVAAAGKNQYTERSIAAAADIAYRLGIYGTAYAHYERLWQGAESDAMQVQGLVGTMRSAAALRDIGLLEEALSRMSANPKVRQEQMEEGWINLGRLRFDVHQFAEADSVYAKLVRSANGEYNDEARCRRAEILMHARQWDKAEKIIESVVADATNDYWLAYSFILWADIYYVRGNTLQAQQTLQSIIDNYDGDDGLVGVAREKLDFISTPLPTPPTDTDDEKMVIEL